MLGFLLAAALNLVPLPAPSPEAWITAQFFRSDSEATNFSAHVGWGMAIPAAGYGLGGKKGLLLASGIWTGYSLVNEFKWHAPESARERNLNLVSRLGSMALVTGLLLIFGKD
jgi:hypothetical protein